MLRVKQLFSALIFLLFSQMGYASDGIYFISGSDPSAPAAELAPLDALTSGARLVAMGESVHSSSKIIQMKDRMTRYLVEKLGFRLILSETPLVRGYGLTKWLQACTSQSLPPPIDLLYNPVEEERALFLWACDFNRKNPRNPVQFRGIDIWDRPWEWQTLTEKFARALALPFKDALQTTREHCALHGDSGWSQYDAMLNRLAREKKFPDADYVPCMQALKYMQSKVIAELKSSKKSAFFNLLPLIESAMGYEDFYNYFEQSLALAENPRDLAQAQNIYSALAQAPHQRAIFFAHTIHTAKMKSPSNWGEAGVGALRSAVSRLDEKMGAQIRTIGLTGYEVGGTSGSELHAFLKPTSPQSMDLALHERGVHAAFVDPRGPYLSSKPGWFMQEENGTDNPNGVYIVPRDNFDLYVFFDESPAGKPILPWRSNWNW